MFSKKWFECDKDESGVSPIFYYSYTGVYGIGQFMKHFIIFLQILEWYSMIYLIKTQKDRLVEEILWDHNAEHLESSSREGTITHQQLRYRKDEVLLKRKFIISGIFCTCIVLSIGCSLYIFKLPELSFVLTGVYFIEMMTFLIVWIKVESWMKNLHRLEYEIS